MIIQWVLCVGLGAALSYAYLQRRKSRAISLGIMLVSAAGVLAVLVPEASNAVARGLGIGRGADLVIYCWIVISLLVSVNLQFKILQLQHSLTLLTREMALRSPTSPGRPGAGTSSVWHTPRPDAGHGKC